ncbi:MAG: carboxypeptidase M32, partial [Phycisphaerae bacterium]|nr:carboxypeptidase M32 [Phycisphaerae bacterium]MDW8261893.1 carboxypeptidase M32 [Phycisphaerales bacterium]
MPTESPRYDALRSELREIGILASIQGLLSYDEQVFQPKSDIAKRHRAEQLEFLARLIHTRFTSPKLGDLIAAVEEQTRGDDPYSDAAVVARHTRRDYDRATKVPAELVAEMARTEVLAQNAWAEARRNADYAAFKPWLARWLELKRQEVQCVGFREHPYDALLDQYEPYETSAGVREIFQSLRDPLIALVRQTQASGRKAPIEILSRSFPLEPQQKFGRLAAETIGFDFTCGRLDVSVHPFCSGMAPGDTRMTTRYDEHHFNDAFFGVLHEAGHALYEQGLPKGEYFGLPLATSVSLGIHESQSRMWENLVGRSRAFWKHFMPLARSAFPDALQDVSEDQWFAAVNAVQPSLIRVEADETTYNLHIFIRFELETAM